MDQAPHSCYHRVCLIQCRLCIQYRTNCVDGDASSSLHKHPHTTCRLRSSCLNHRHPSTPVGPADNCSRQLLICRCLTANAVRYLTAHAHALAAACENCCSGNSSQARMTHDPLRHAESGDRNKKFCQCGCSMMACSLCQADIIIIMSEWVW